MLFLPFRLYGHDNEDDVVKGISDPLPGNVRLVSAEIRLIDHESKRGETSDGDYAYDWLISTMGCRLAPEEIEGMDGAIGDGVHIFYDLQGALGFQKALDDMTEGRFVVDIAEMPSKCPVAPLEFAFLADYYFHRRGIRDRIDITLVTP